VLVSGTVEGAADTQALLVDRTAPAAPAFTTPAIVRTPAPSNTGTGPAGTMLTLSIRRAGQSPVTVYRTMVGPDGTWRVDLGRLTPTSGILETLADGDYDLTATATSPTGLVSAAATHRLTVDTAAPVAPTFTSPTFTTDTTPVITGTAEPNSLLRLTIGNAVFETQVAANGTWSVDIGDADTVAGTRITLPLAVHELRAVSIDAAGNESPEAFQLLRVAGSGVAEPPAVLALAASFGTLLAADEAAAGATVQVIFAGIEDGRVALLAVNGSGFTATVTGGAATFSLPAATLQSLPQGAALFVAGSSNQAGTATPAFSSPFTVDTLGPARPTVTSVTSTANDRTPNDVFTALVQPTVVVVGEPGQTPVIRGPEGIVSPARYTVTEAPAGTYTIAFLDAQVRGDYFVNLEDASGNENSNGTGPAAQNFFRIDSVPVLYDQTAKRQVIAARVYGNLGVINYLAGAAFPVDPQADGSWIDLDGERLTMGLVGGAEQLAGGRVVSMTTSVNGASLTVMTATGAYTYTPVAGTSRIDEFLLFVRDESGNETQLTLSFDSRDYLDRDSIPMTTESRLAGPSGDRNGDGRVDAQQNSVTTLAWGPQPNFAASLNTATLARVNPRTISTMVVNTRPLNGAGGRNFSSLAELMRDADPLAQLLDISVVAPAAVSATSPVTGGFQTVRWDAMKYSVESLASWGLIDLMPGRAGTQIQVSFDVSAAGMLTRSGTSGVAAFTAARKFVSAGTITEYAAVGLSLRDLDGNVITRPDWYDFTARDHNNDGVYDTDGVVYVDFQAPGQPGYGIVDAAVVILTDNAFGDDDPTIDRVVDPFLPGTGNSAPSLADAATTYLNTPVFDVFDARTGTLAATDPDGDTLVYGIVGGTVQGTLATATNNFGTLQVNTATGGWVFVPSNPALNAVSTAAIATFTTTVSDGRLAASATLRVHVTPPAATGVTGTFLVGSADPFTNSDVRTNLSLLGPTSPVPSVPVRQKYIQFTLTGLSRDVTIDDLRFYANDRLISLRKTRLVKVSQEGDTRTYRLLNITEISAARSRYVFTIGGPAGWIATSWRRF
jgi:hypothetical protein